MDNEIKKIGGNIWYMDGSYKGAKKLVRVNGQPIVSVLNSIMTEITAMRSQFFSPTDGQDQYEMPIKRMLETMRQLGHPGPRMILYHKCTVPWYRNNVAGCLMADGWINLCIENPNSKCPNNWSINQSINQSINLYQSK